MNAWEKAEREAIVEGRRIFYSKGLVARAKS